MQRYRVCPEHCAASQVLVSGKEQRFCQQVRMQWTLSELQLGDLAD